MRSIIRPKPFYPQFFSKLELPKGGLVGVEYFSRVAKTTKQEPPSF